MSESTASMEDKARLALFHSIYRLLKDEEPDPTVRFATAIVRSARAKVQDYKLLSEWARARRPRKSEGKVDEENNDTDGTEARSDTGDSLVAGG